MFSKSNSLRWFGHVQMRDWVKRYEIQVNTFIIYEGGGGKPKREAKPDLVETWSRMIRRH